MNAIEKFAREHGRDIDKSLARKFQQAVESVIGDRGRVIDSWVDSTGNRLHPIEWKVSIVSDDMEDDGREICLELVTDFEGKSHFICDFWDRDSNLIASEVGEVGEFDPLPLIDKVLGKSESKKNEDHPDEYYKWANEKVAEEYADESGIFFEIVDDMMRLFESMVEDIISEQGLEDTEKTKEDLKDVIYDHMCDTMVNMFGGVTKDR
ncbi:MAG: hypothetical protein IK038_02310 [Bacteroidaceae bacterium]|nr:hypothetical protein [Bacteroidaceae bacterium]